MRNCISLPNSSAGMLAGILILLLSGCGSQDEPGRVSPPSKMQDRGKAGKKDPKFLDLEILDAKRLAGMPSLQTSLRFSPDFQKVAYFEAVYRYARIVSGSLSAHLNGETLIQDCDIFLLNTPVFSDDSTRAAFALRKGKEWFVHEFNFSTRMTNRAGPFKDVIVNSLRYSEENGRFARQIIRKDGKTATVVDEKVVGVHEGVGLVWFSPEGDHHAFEGIVKDKEGTHQELLLDGKVIASDHQVTFLGFAGKTGRYAYRTFDGKLWHVHLDGKELGAGFLEVFSFGFDPRGKRNAFIGTRDGKVFMVVDGKESSPLEDAGDPVFSRDGTRLGYAAKQKDAWHMILDGKASPPHEYIGEGCPVFSDDGKRVAYWGINDRSYGLYVDGKKNGTFEVIGDLPLRFSPGGKRLALMVGTFKEESDRSGFYDYVEANRESSLNLNLCLWNVVVDGKNQPSHPEIGRFLFSPDGHQLVTIAGEGMKWRLYSEKARSPLYRAFGFHYGGGVQFLDDKRIRYTAITTGGEIQVVTASLPD